MNEKDFGTYLTKIRERRGYKSQRQLALDAGISPATLSRIEAGSQRAQPDTLERLAPFLRVSYEELMQECGYLKADEDGKETRLENDDPGIQLMNRARQTMSRKSYRLLVRMAEKMVKELEQEDTEDDKHNPS